MGCFFGWPDAGVCDAGESDDFHVLLQGGVDFGHGGHADGVGFGVGEELDFGFCFVGWSEQGDVGAVFEGDF